MSTKKLTFPAMERSAKTKALKFTDMSDAELNVWEKWFAEHHERDYSVPRERSYFRTNKANCHAETTWRYSGIPF